jgi:hypothetical protein
MCEHLRRTGESCVEPIMLNRELQGIQNLPRVWKLASVLILVCGYDYLGKG